MLELKIRPSTAAQTDLLDGTDQRLGNAAVRSRARIHRCGEFIEREGPALVLRNQLHGPAPELTLLVTKGIGAIVHPLYTIRRGIPARSVQVPA